MVFYFTGTGNSLYIAKQIEAEPVSIPQIIKKETLDFSDDSIGIVCPVYGHEVPPMVKDFMKKAEFHTDYFYMILTYGNRHGEAAELARDLCRECGIEPDYINVVLMVDNWLPSFDMEEQKHMDKNVEGQMDKILSDLKKREHKISEVTDQDRTAHIEFLTRMKGLPEDAWQHLIRVTDRCIGCGICEKVCPSGSIHVENGRAVYVPGNCQTCLACAHHCPEKAIGLNMPEENPNARYRNEHISLEEIIKANQQTK